MNSSEEVEVPADEREDESGPHDDAGLEQTSPVESEESPVVQIDEPLQEEESEPSGDSENLTDEDAVQG